MSQIFLNDLIVDAKHGLYDHEKVKNQRFKIDLELEVDNDLAFQSDDVNDTIDYAYIRQTVINTIKNNTFSLIERLAEEVADQILTDKRITELTLSIYKLDAFPTGVPGIKVTYTQS